MKCFFNNAVITWNIYSYIFSEMYAAEHNAIRDWIFVYADVSSRNEGVMDIYTDI